MRQRGSKGYSSTELVAVTGVFGMVLVFVVQSVGLADSVFRKAQTSGIGLKEARKAVEAIMADVRAAERSLAKYPTGGESVFQAQEDRALILRLPERRQDGTLNRENATIKIYHIEPTSGPNGPYQIVLSEAQVTGSHEGAPARRKVVARQVEDASFTQSTEQTFFGDGETKTFHLAAPALGSSDNLTERVLIGGQERLSEGLAAFDGATLTLAKAPKSQVPVDVHYRIDPGFAAGSQGANAATSVTLFVQFRQVWRTAKHAEAFRTTQFLTRNALLNK